MSIKQPVGQCLQEHGFELDIREPFSFIGRKTYASAVGPKEAHSFLERFGDGSFILKAEMLSEGRNCLALCYSIIPKDADAEKIKQCVASFANEVDQAVAGSYAVRLLVSKTRNQGSRPTRP
ncbi:hypothetical protein CBP36_19625 (plasmid) [Acidovorax carolinensis]|uniref:Uncharacterized protein n=1 Tax=Acidovorax carolinensis TaxID=553814 RepID=A0A240UI57_9BURK|nr:hypothetical protein [Acidovorax carolinensis]ART57116.1 hypothetical protein CBP35_19580 [Acidovorax carolinensis]ART61177.1 hypothetical protein CBP36_19625 [Acidovorax carolinensis]